MKKWGTGVLLLVSMLCALPAYSLGKLQGYVEKGGQSAVSGSSSALIKVQRSYPQALVQVYLAGTSTLATLYSDSALTAKANPFTAGVDGFWSFYAADGDYDVRFSGGGIATPYTWSGLRIVSGGVGVFDIRTFGAVCDGTTDDTVAIQRAIDTAETYISSPNVYQPKAPAIHIPGGSTGCKVTASLIVKQPIRIYGDGYHTSGLVVTASFNAPVIKIAPNQAQSTYVVYRIDNLYIEGPQTWLGSGPLFGLASDNMDGIRVESVAPANDTTVEIDRVRITKMTGNGVYLNEENNSPRITNSVFEVNSKAGIRAGGNYTTNAWIDNNIVRENRVGIMYRGNSTLSSGRITRNLIESNNGHKDSSVLTAAFDSDFPSVGLWLYQTYTLEIRDNYWENHANGIYCEADCHFNLISGGYYLDSTFALSNYGPPVRRLGLFMRGTGNVVENMVIYGQPSNNTGGSAKWIAAGDSTFTVTNATNASPIVVTTSAAHGIPAGRPITGVNGYKVTISGVTGNTAANGTFYIKYLSTTAFALYTNELLTTAVAGNGAYAGSGSMYIAQYGHIQDTSGINTHLNHRDPTNTYGWVYLDQSFDRHTYISSQRDSGDGGSQRPVLAEELWAKRTTTPSFSWLLEGTAAGGGAGTNMMEFLQKATGTTTARITVADNNSALAVTTKRADSGAEVTSVEIGYGGLLRIRWQGIVFAFLGAYLPADGMQAYCTNCDPPANPPVACTTGGASSGSMVTRIAGVNVCHY